MWDHAGIARSNARLDAAAEELNGLRAAARDVCLRDVTSETVELRNLAEVSSLIVACARQRRESRGLHFNIDFPYRDNETFLRDTSVSRSVAVWRNGVAQTGRR